MGGALRATAHAMVSRGGWTQDGEWAPVAYVDERSAGLLFRHKVMRLLQNEGLLSEERTELLLSWRHSGFSVHNQVYVEPENQPAVEGLARYIMRPPISLERMQWGGEGVVLYRAKGGHEGRTLPAGNAAESFEPSEFLARVIMHIPDPRRHLVRYYEWYSNVSRGRQKLRLGRLGVRTPARPPERLVPRPAIPAASGEAGPSSASGSTRSIRWCAPRAAAR